MPAVTEITVTGTEDAPIQVWLVSSDTGEPKPLVHMIHGGPHGIFGDQWHWRWNAAVFAGDLSERVIQIVGAQFSVEELKAISVS